jgi:1-acyl-sn-glycerol-3-phosphate acyltransferase
MAGVLFVHRGSKESRSSVLETMRTLIEKGFSLVVFPEGTTSRAPSFLPFKSGAFKLAAQKTISIVPMAIEFVDPDDAWVGDDTFLRHFFQTFRKKKIQIRMSIGPSFVDADSERLKRNIHEWIETELNNMI